MPAENSDQDDRRDIIVWSTLKTFDHRRGHWPPKWICKKKLMGAVQAAKFLDSIVIPEPE
jgi:hypothetical protein